MSGTHALKPGEILFLSDGGNTVGAVKAGSLRHVFIETEGEELVLALGEEDLIAASAFAGGEGARHAIACMLYLVREGRMPLLALPRDHPATKRLPLVVSAGETIRLTSCIVPGTHPEQDVLCGRGALDGVVLRGTPGGVCVEGGGVELSAEIGACLFYSNVK